MTKFKKITVKRIAKTGKWRFCADRPELCGSPNVGYGKTPKEAIGDLFYYMYKDLGIELELPEEEYKRIKKEYEDNK